MTTPKPNPSPSGYQMNLMVTPNPRLADLAKMRSKLATAKPIEMVAAESRRENRAKITAKSLAYGISATAMLALVGLICWAAIADQDLSPTQVVKGVPKVATPGQVKSIDEQTLYWAYALYDWNKLVQTYQVPKNALLDTHKAKLELDRLLPQASGDAQLAVMKYRNQAVRRL
jgi:hypothetical protein